MQQFHPAADPQLRERLEKIWQLYKRGATEGERNAAKSRIKSILAARGVTWNDYLVFRRGGKPPQQPRRQLETFRFKYSSKEEKAILVDLLGAYFGGRFIAAKTGRRQWLDVELTATDGHKLATRWETLRARYKAQVRSEMAAIARNFRQTAARYGANVKHQ